MRLKKHHDLSDRLLISPTRGDPFDPFGAETVELQQSVWFILDDIEHVFAKRFDQRLGEVRTDTPDHAASQVFLDAVDGTGWQNLEEGRPELHAVITMVVPSATALDELTGLDGCGGPEDRDQFAMTTDLDPEDAKSGIWAMEGHTFDQPRKRFAVMIAVG